MKPKHAARRVDPLMRIENTIRVDEKRMLVAVFFISLALRVLLMILLDSYQFPNENNFRQMGYEMGRIAAEVNAGNGFSFPWSTGTALTAWMPPVYPYFIAFIFRLFGTYSIASAFVLETFQSLFSSLTCLLLYGIGKRIFSYRVGLLSAFMFAVYPASIFFSVKRIWSTALFVLFLSLLVWNTLRIRERFGAPSLVGQGLLMGVTSLVDPVSISFFPFVTAWLLTGHGFRGKRAVSLAIIILTAVVTVLPWTIRNYLVFGRVIPIKSNFGNELWIGNNAEATGSDVTSGGKDMLSTLPKTDMNYIADKNEVERSQFLLKKALLFVRSNPAEALKLSLRKSYFFWWEIGGENDSYDQLRKWTYGIPLALAILGVILLKRKWQMASLLFFFFLSFPTVFYITHVSNYRYRFPIEPFLLIFGAHAVDVFLAQTHWFAREAPQDDVEKNVEISQKSMGC